LPGIALEEAELHSELKNPMPWAAKPSIEHMILHAGLLAHRARTRSAGGIAAM
jgi:hypothetical protein